MYKYTSLTFSLKRYSLFNISSSKMPSLLKMATATQAAGDTIVTKSLNHMLSKGHARRLSPVENFFALAQRQKVYKNFTVVVQFDKKVSNKRLLYHGLRNLLLKNPMLCLTVVNTDKYQELTMIPTPEHDYIKILDKLKFKDLFLDVKTSGMANKSQMMSVLNEIVLPYGHGHGFWKLVLLDDYTLAYISNHMVSDGLSAKYFFQDLQKELNSIEVDISADEDYNAKLVIDYETDQDSIPKLQVPLDEIVPHKPPLWYYPEFFWNMFMCKKYTFSVPSVPNAPHHYRSFNVTPEELFKIKLKTKRQGITLTPYFKAAWLYSEHQMGILDGWSYVDMIIAVDTRHYIPNSIDKDLYRYGLHACTYHTYLKKVTSFTWGKVKEFSEYSRWVVSTKRALYRLGFITSEKLAKKHNLDKLVKDQLIKNPKGNTMISNIGVLEDTGDGFYQVKDAVFSQHVNGMYFTFVLCSITTPDSGLNFTLTVPKGDISSEKLDQLILKFKQNLIEGCIE